MTRREWLQGVLAGVVCVAVPRSWMPPKEYLMTVRLPAPGIPAKVLSVVPLAAGGLFLSLLAAARRPVG